jgi:hypothetical protein
MPSDYYECSNLDVVKQAVSVSRRHIATLARSANKFSVPPCSTVIPAEKGGDKSMVTKKIEPKQAPKQAPKKDTGKPVKNGKGKVTVKPATKKCK